VIDAELPQQSHGEIDRWRPIERASSQSSLETTELHILIRGLGHFDWVVQNPPNATHVPGQAINFRAVRLFSLPTIFRVRGPGVRFPPASSGCGITVDTRQPGVFSRQSPDLRRSGAHAPDEVRQQVIVPGLRRARRTSLNFERTSRKKWQTTGYPTGFAAHLRRSVAPAAALTFASSRLT
jgi:hypothetical protein